MSVSCVAPGGFSDDKEEDPADWWKRQQEQANEDSLKFDSEYDEDNEDFAPELVELGDYPCI